MTRQQLEKYGWVLISRRRAGMVIIAKWRDPKTGEIQRQGDATRIQVERNRARRSSTEELQC